MVRRRRIPMLALLLPLAACGGGDGAPPAPDPDEVDRLRSLPYAGHVPDTAAEQSGVVLREAARMQPGLTLYAVQLLGRADLIDESGAVLRSWSHPARWERAELLRGGGLLAIGSDTPGAGPADPIPDDSRYVVRFDPEGRLVWKRRLTAHHDIERTPDGRLLVLTFARRRLPQIDPRLDVRDDRLTWLDESGIVVDELSLLDALAARADVLELRPTPPNRLGVVPWVDLIHANSVETIDRPELAGRHELYRPGNLLVCMRHQDSIAVIDPREREAVWAWGRGTLQSPHDARLLPDGHILVFDNGVGRGWSRVLELDPPSGRIVWEYRATPPESFYSLSKGSCQRLANGNTLIAESDRGRAFEITPAGEVVWDFRCPHRAPTGDRAAIVRAVRYDREFFEGALPSGAGR